MSWHTGGVAIQGVVDNDPAAVVAALGFSGRFNGQAVDGETAGSSSLRGRAVGVLDGWTLVWDPMMLMGDDPDADFGDAMFPTAVGARLCALSVGRRLFAFLTEGASTTHGYAVYVDGQRIRVWLEQEDAVILNEGTPLPEEGAFTEVHDGEARVLGMLEAFTGVSFDRIFDAEFALVE